MISPDRNSILKQIADGSPFFGLQRPGTSLVELYILSPDPKPLEENRKLFCLSPFDSGAPITYVILAECSVEAQEWSKLNLQGIKVATAPDQASTSREDYLNGVDQAIKQFSVGSMDKAVLAQRQCLPISNPNPLSLFQRLTVIENSYCYVFHHPNHGTWTGASPELFFKSNGKELETMALAGTRVLNSSANWGGKEIKEQAVVGQYITQELSTLGFTDIALFPAFTKTLGEIEHICSPVKAQFPSGRSWYEVASHLHPTPALAGFPKDKSINFIHQHESFDRELFGGYMGIAQAEVVELFVNIRCAKVHSNYVWLYAGAGLNVHSVPEAEWEETQNKLDVMRSFYEV